jgi:hypothetical protein
MDQFYIVNEIIHYAIADNTARRCNPGSTNDYLVLFRMLNAEGEWIERRLSITESDEGSLWADETLSRAVIQTRR